MDYNVVFRTIVQCTHTGVVTWTSFRSKEHFDQWYSEKMKTWYEVVEEGVSQERAIELCSSRTATLAALGAQVKEAEQILESILAKDTQ